MTVRAGRLRHYVTVQQATETQDTDGSVIQTWGTYAQVYAEISPKSGSEDYAAAGINASVVHEIRIRYLDGLTPKMRIVYGDRTFEIVGVVNWGERDREQLLTCTEVV
jgi:SPP1 family predicted phage head-tail adaptor